MKLVLTSSGIANKSIENKLREFLGKDFKDMKVLFCTTASNYDGGEMNEWVIDDIIKLNNLGFKIDICDINGVPENRLMSRIEWANILYFEGGNDQWLAYSIKKLGLDKHLNEILKTKIWIGASAGSTVLCPTVINSCQKLFGEDQENLPIYGLSIVNFQFIPHYNNEWFPQVNEENLRKEFINLKEQDGKKLYAIDDEGALFFDNNKIEIVTEGKYLELKGENKI